MKLKNALMATALTFGLLGAAQANIVTTDVNVLQTNPGTVQYVAFDVTTAGTFSINAFGSQTFGSAYLGDPMIHLFRNSLSQSNYLIGDDDSGAGFNSLISNISLALGHYVLAVSEFSLSVSEAIVGSNFQDVGDSTGLVRVQIDSTNGFAQLSNDVPEPGTMALLGIALGGLALRRRKTVA